MSQVLDRAIEESFEEMDEYDLLDDMVEQIALDSPEGISDSSYDIEDDLYDGEGDTEEFAPLGQLPFDDGYEEQDFEQDEEDNELIDQMLGGDE